jgi:hypothetical protein
LLKDFSPADKRADQGVLNESFVLLELLPRLRPNMELRFWRTRQGQEVDFVLLIEVKTTLERLEIPKAVATFLDAYPESLCAFIVPANLDQHIDYRGKPIRFVRNYEFTETLFDSLK